MIKMLRSGVFVGLVAVLLTGCYESQQEVIRVSDSMPLNGLPGSYDLADGGRLQVSSVPGTNDYRYEQVSKGGKTSAGYLRVVWLKDEIYVLQVKPDADASFYIMFYHFGSSDRAFQEYFVTEESFDAQWALQKEFGVSINVENYGSELEGPRENVFRFLMAHKRLQFSEGETNY